MLISCPSCETPFSVPDEALGSKGRTLKCARCGHKWFQPSPLAAAAPPPPPPEPEREEFVPPPPPQAEPPLLPGFEEFKFSPSDFEPERDPPPAPKDDLTEPGFADFFDEEDRMPAALSARAPRRTPEPGRRGGGGVFLWTVAIGLLVATLLGGAMVLLQDQIVGLVPSVGKAMEQVGLREPVVGEGLQIRNQRPERVIEANRREVLIIRGVIANVSERPRDVPWVRAQLVDENNVVVMDKMVRAPVDGLDPGATTVFTIRMESPHPDAKRIVLAFAWPPAK